MIVINQDSILYQVTEADRRLAKALAEESCNKYSKIIDDKSPYHQNNLRSHIVGKIGEVAAGNMFLEMKQLLQWSYDIEQVYLDSNRDSSCDIIINNLKIEIKTWRPCDWEQFGACISERQAVKLNKKCHVVVYGTFDDLTGEFTLRGFNTTQDIKNVLPKLTGRIHYDHKTGAKIDRRVLNRVMRPRCITQLPISQTEEVN